MRPLRWVVAPFLLAVLAFGLAACGPAKKSVFPPTVSIQQLQVLSNGQWQLSVRIQNNSYAGMDFQSLDGQLQVAALAPVRLHDTFELAIPQLAGDVVQLKHGADFEELAKRYSMDPGTKNLGGDLGWNRRGSGLVPEFEAMMFSLRPGELSPVFRTSFGQQFSMPKIANYLRDGVKAKTLAIVYVNNDFGKGGRNAIIKELETRGIKVVADLSTESGQADFAADAH